MIDVDDVLRQSRILIVDDHPVNVALLEQILEEEGYRHIETTTRSDAVVGLYAARRYDLVLLDLRMPPPDGITILHQLAELRADDYLPVLVLTAQTDTRTRQRALAAGAQDFLCKPFERWEVLLRIHNMLRARWYYNRHRDRAEDMEAEVRRRTRQVWDTQLAITRALGRAGEYRDEETGQHVARMSRYAQRLALAAGLGEGQAELLLNAAPMHDVGKIGVPDQILRKPGPLSAAERRIMERHTVIGAEILGDHNSDLMRQSADIALAHHEKWDGSGYPRGLAGGDIPLSARIVAVCDVFDALCSERPHKRKWAFSESLEYIQGQSGSHFDPKLIHAFSNAFSDILDIAAEYAELPISATTG